MQQFFIVVFVMKFLHNWISFMDSNFTWIMMMTVVVPVPILYLFPNFESENKDTFYMIQCNNYRINPRQIF